MIGVFFIGSSIRAMHGVQRAASPDIFTDIPILLTNAVLPLSNVYGVLADEEAGAFCKAAKKLATTLGGATLPLSMDDETEQ